MESKEYFEKLLPNLRENEELARLNKDFVERSRTCMRSGICPGCGGNNVILNDEDEELYYLCSDCRIEVYTEKCVIKKPS